MANTHSVSLQASSLQYLSITDANQTGLDLSGDFTIECWIKLESILTSDGSINLVSKEGNTSGNYGYKMYIDKYSADGIDNQITVLYRNSANQLTRFSINTKLNSGYLSTWMHLAGAVNVGSKTMSFYINGISQAYTTRNNSASDINNNTGPLEIGAWSGSQYFYGLIDDVRIWNDIRTAQEISDNINVELVGNEANLVAYWKLNNSLLDETSNNNDLTNNNSATFSTDVPFAGASAVVHLLSSTGVGR